MEEEITFMSEDNQIEGVLNKSTAEKGVVITHPHPLYGGDMHNPVVKSVANVYQKKGYSTLRFNFRGVGNSQGSYGAGVGEQEDVSAALAFLTEMSIKNIDLAGYSFGAWVNAHLTCQQAGIQHMVMISPPVAFIDFDDIGSIDCLKLIVTGSHDEIAPVDLISRLQPQWNPHARFEVIEGADHFYIGYLNKLQAVLAS